MIANERELQTTLERITWFQHQLTHLRRTEANPVNYRAAASGFLAEIDRMQLEVREATAAEPVTRDAEDIFAEMQPYLATGDTDVDDSREAIYTRLEGE